MLPFVKSKVGTHAHKILPLRNIFFYEVVLISNPSNYCLLLKIIKITLKCGLSPLCRKTRALPFLWGWGRAQLGREASGLSLGILMQPCPPPFSLALALLVGTTVKKHCVSLASIVSTLPFAHCSPGPLSFLSPGEESQFEMDI